MANEQKRPTIRDVAREANVSIATVSRAMSGADYPMNDALRERVRSAAAALGYQPNRAVLHTDTRVMPGRRAAWAAWNYERAANCTQESARVCLHYWLNRLQPLPFAQPVLVSLNPVRGIDPARVLGAFDYDHPVFDLGALAAQKQLPLLQGAQHTWFAGAWTGYGFHEDGLQSGYRAADALLAQLRRREAA